MRPQREDNLEVLFKVLAHDQIKFDRDLVLDNNFVLGAKCTHFVKPNDFDFLHDLSHLVQFNDEEIHTHYIDQGGKITFEVPQEWIFNRWICEPVTDQISMREIETMYIQYILDNTILNKGMSFIEWMDHYEIDDLMNFLPDRYIFGHKLSLEQISEKCTSFFEKWTYESVIAKWQSIKIK